ncbi:MAG: tyrosine-type recombinase/integrase family protein [Clostridia bacterium]|nr:tyrosine-type recombinase/integrase family protein [Clostridia bacterium]
MKYEYIRKTFTYNGKRYTVRGKTEEEALRKLIEKQIELKNNDTQLSDITVKTWAYKVMETYKPNVSEEYKRQMLYRLNGHILPAIGAKKLKDVTPLDCQLILNSQKGKSKSHIEKIYQELNFIFFTAVKNDLIRKNPADGVEKPSGTNRKRRALTPEERKHLLAVLPSDPRFVFFALMLYCGCRPAEAANVLYEDVKEIDGVAVLHIRGTKTANADRYVPIPDALKPVLLTKKSGLVATTLSGGKHYYSSYKRMVAALERAMNISMGCTVYRNELIPPLPLAEDFVPYLLRHTYCTDLKKMGVDVRIAKQLMGHSNITTTANIYDHNDNESLLIAIKQMGLS